VTLDIPPLNRDFPPVFDGHEDFITQMERGGGFPPSPPRDFLEQSDDGHVDLPRAMRGGLGGCFTSIYLTDERAEANALYYAMREMSDVFRIAFYQGLRRGELLALRRGAVDLEGRRMRIGDEAFIPKGRDENVVTITLPTHPYLEKHCREKASPERLFPFNSPGRLTGAFKEAASEAVPEKPGLHFHSLRRSAGYYWAERGMSPWDVKDLLRHKSLRTTEQFYVQGRLRGQMERFDRAYEEEGLASSSSAPEMAHNEQKW